MKKIILGVLTFILISVYLLMHLDVLREKGDSFDLSSLASEEKKDEVINSDIIAEKINSINKDKLLIEEKHQSVSSGIIINGSSIDSHVVLSVNPDNSDKENIIEIPVAINENVALLNDENIESNLSRINNSAQMHENIDTLENIELQNVPEIINPLAEKAEIDWQELDSGLDYKNKKEKFFLDKLILDVDVHILRINTDNYEIDLYGTFLQEGEGKSVRAWAIEHDLTIAINASMYLPDNKTSNGYMRSGGKINNGKIMERMSGFFFSKPKKENLAQSTIVEVNNVDDKNKMSLNEYIESYEVAIQNFRILGNYRDDINESEILWEQNSVKSSISAYGEDVDGNIYIVFSRAPLSVHEFANYMLSLTSEGIYLKNLLYAEGGSEAGLFLETEENQYFIAGIVRNTPFSNIGMSVPNVLGVKKRKQ